MENSNYEKGTLGWIREKQKIKAKKDGFDNVDAWLKWNTDIIIKRFNNVDILKKILEEDKVKIKDEVLFDSFWRKVDIKDNINECWPWIASTNQKGYGHIRVGISMVQSHRLAYELIKGPIPEELQVQHLCNNPVCCNPNHLEVGNDSKNSRYKFQCNRQNHNGENNPCSKLTDDQVREIHKLYNEQRKLHPGFKHWQIIQPIAQMFGIDAYHVGSIIRGDSWHHIKVNIL